jgi:hypothetical protein
LLSYEHFDNRASSTCTTSRPDLDRLRGLTERLVVEMDAAALLITPT